MCIHLSSCLQKHALKLFIYLDAPIIVAVVLAVIESSSIQMDGNFSWNSAEGVVIYLHADTDSSETVFNEHETLISVSYEVVSRRPHR